MQKFSIFILAGLFLWSCQELPLIRAPFKGVENKTETLTFDVSQGGRLSLPNGTVITVPPDAFVTAAGQPVNGNVNLSYTEMQDVASILISGIPLNLGEGKNMDVMESAVMFDIRADQNGNPLKLAAEKTIETQISSNQGDPAYNLYKLDEGEKNWAYLDNIIPEANPTLLAANQSIDEAGKSAENMDISNCIAFNYLEFIDVWKKPKDKLFNYYTYAENPNLNTLKRLIREKLNGYGAGYIDGYNWEEIRINGKNLPAAMVLWELEKPVPDNIYKVKSTDIKMKKLKGGRYLFDLRRYKSGKYAAGGKWVPGKYITLYSFIAKPRMPLAALYANPIKNYTATYDSLLMQIESQKAIAAMQNEVVRSFAINELGIYNYDIIKDEERILVEARPVMNGKPVEGNTDYFAILKGRNSVIRYSPEGMKKFVIYPGLEMYLFKLTSGNKVISMKGNPVADLDLQALGSQENPGIEIEFETTGFVINSPGDVSAFVSKVTAIENEKVVVMR